MTGQELHNHLNAARRAAGAKLVNWISASGEYKQAMTTAGADLQLISGSGGLTTQAAAPPASAAVPITPSTPGVDPKMSIFVAQIPQAEAQQLYELLFMMRGCRIYKH